MMRSIIEQGMAEGALKPAFPDQAAEVIYTLMQGMGDGFANLVFKADSCTGAAQDNGPGQRLERIVAAYNDALERILGAPTGSIHLMDAETVRIWSP
jgi:hypothetical protein